MTIKSLSDQMAALTAKIDNINSNNRNYNNRKNQNRRCGPIRVHGGTNRIMEDSKFLEVKEKYNIKRPCDRNIQTTVHPCSLGGGIVMANSSLKLSQDALQADPSDPCSISTNLERISMKGITQLNASKGYGSSSISTNLQRNHSIGGLQLQVDDNHDLVEANVILGCGEVRRGSFLDVAAPSGLFGLGTEKISVLGMLSKVDVINSRITSEKESTTVKVDQLIPSEPTLFFSYSMFSSNDVAEKSRNQFPISTTHDSMIDFQVTLYSTHFVRKCLLGLKNTSQIFEKLSTPTPIQQVPRPTQST
jgi:hypothetical protein